MDLVASWREHIRTGGQVVNKPKRDGTDAENRVKEYAIERGWIHADRLTLSGAQDRGDIRLGDGVEFTLEVKGGQGAIKQIHSHVREMVAEMHNNGHNLGAVIAKKAGSRNVGSDWLAVMPAELLFDILDILYGDLNPQLTPPEL